MFLTLLDLHFSWYISQCCSLLVASHFFKRDFFLHFSFRIKLLKAELNLVGSGSTGWTPYCSWSSNLTCFQDFLVLSLHAGGFYLPCSLRMAGMGTGPFYRCRSCPRGQSVGLTWASSWITAWGPSARWGFVSLPLCVLSQVVLFWWGCYPLSWLPLPFQEMADELGLYKTL